MTTTGNGGGWNRRRAGCRRRDAVAPDHAGICNNTVGRTSVLGRRTDPILRSACSWRVTTMWVNEHSQLEISAFRRLQPVKVSHHRCDVLILRRSMYQSGGDICILLRVGYCLDLVEILDRVQPALSGVKFNIVAVVTKRKCIRLSQLPPCHTPGTDFNCIYTMLMPFNSMINSVIILYSNCRTARSV